MRARPEFDSERAMKSYIRQSVNRMSGYVPGEQPTDPNVIKLNTNENPYPPSPAVMAAAASFDASCLRRYPDPLCTALREQLAELHGCAPRNILVGNGSDEVLALCTRAFVEGDGTIGYLDPSYSLYPVLAAIRGVATRPVTLNERFEWTPADVGASSLFFFVNPHAPTGRLSPREDVRALIERVGGVVVVDEAYVDFARENCMDIALSSDRVLVARTFSKSYALAGLRVGYVVGSETLIEAMFKIKDSYNMDAFTQQIARAALRDVAYMRAMAEKIKTTRTRVAGALSAMGCEVTPSESNFLWVRPRGMTARDLYETLKRRGILIRYFTGPRVGAYVRITVGTDEQMDTLLHAMRELMRE